MAKDDDKRTLTPKLRFPEFRDVPGWGDRLLGDICQPQQWATISSTDLSDQGYAVYGANGFIGYYPEFNHKFETVAVTCRGSTCGEVTLIPAKSYITGNSMCLDEIDAERNSYRFLYQFLKYRGFRDVISGSAQPQIVGNAIKKVRLAVPEVREQQKVAACLSSLDELIAAEGRKLEALKVHKKGLMQQLFPRPGQTRPRLRFPEFQDSGEWEETKAGDWFTNRKTKGEAGLPIYSVTMHDGMVRRDSFDRDFYDIKDATGNKKACKGDIAYNMMRMWQGALGVAAEDSLVSPAYIVLAPQKNTVSEFFAYLFKLPTSLLLLTSHSRGLTKDRLRLYYEDFARIPLRCPSKPEQQRIVGCLSALDAVLAGQSQKLAALKTHKQALMQQLFPSSAEVEA